MRMRNFLLNRKSVREYKNRSIGIRKMRAVEELLENIEDQDHSHLFDLVLFKDGKKVQEALEGQGGYSGVMIKSPHYIGVRLKEANNRSILHASYYAEELKTELIRLDLGTCWVTIKDASIESKTKALGEENKDIGYLIAFGEAKAKNPFDTVEPAKSSRVAISEFVFKEELGNPINPTDLESRGLDDLIYYLRFAPSTRNSQPCKLVLKKDRMELYLERSFGKISMMDAGILMYYFHSLASYIGLTSVWEIEDDIEETSEGLDIKKVAYFKL